jgi:hypothetical protein
MIHHQKQRPKRERSISLLRSSTGDMSDLGSKDG